MKKMTLRLALGAVACLGFGSTTIVHAQQTCADLDFVPAVTDRWPFANDGCLEIVTRDDGKSYARFEAEVISQSPSGTFLRYTLRDGTRTPSRRADPPPGIVAVIEGQETPIRDLQVRQRINVYLPDSAWAQPAAPAEPMAAAPPPPPPPPPPEPEPEPAPVMPTTAGNAGWLALMGGMLLLLGGALRFARQEK